MNKWKTKGAGGAGKFAGQDTALRVELEMTTENTLLINRAAWRAKYTELLNAGMEVRPDDRGLAGQWAQARRMAIFKDEFRKSTKTFLKIVSAGDKLEKDVMIAAKSASDVSIVGFEGEGAEALVKQLSEKHAQNSAVASAFSARNSGRTARAIRIGGKLLIIAGAARDAYEVYTAEDRWKTITTRLSGWAGSRAGSEIGFKVGTAAGFALGGPTGAGILGRLGGIAGGLGGYHFGVRASTRVYDGLFSRGTPGPIAGSSLAPVDDYVPLGPGFEGFSNGGGSRFGGAGAGASF